MDRLDDAGRAVYRAFLEQPDADLDALAERLDLPRTQVAAALDRLVEVGLIGPSASTPAPAPTDLDPQVGLLLVAERVRADIDERLDTLAVDRAEMARLVARLGEGGAGAPADQYARTASPQAGVELLLRRASTGVRICLRGTRIPEDVRSALLEALPAAVARGVRVQVLVEHEAIESAATRALVAWLAQLGADVRSVDSVSVTTVLADDGEALMLPGQDDLPAPAGDPPPAGTWCRHPAMLLAVADLFERTWSTGVPCTAGTAAAAAESAAQDEAADAAETTDDDQVPVPARGVEWALGSPEATAVLRLLTSGAKDEAIARSLHVSVRTLQRAMSAMWDELGASNRLQAGVLAARKGLL